MLRIFGNNTSSPYPECNTVATIGMFDGVHLGHKKVIEKVIETAKSARQPSVAITFDVHPKSILGIAPAMICSLEHRLQLLSQLGLDCVWVISFTQEFATITAKEFTDKFFIKKLAASYIYLGATGNFGYKGEGDIAFLNNNYPELTAETVPKVKIGQTVVSSSKIRDYTSSGKLQQAAELLGRAPSVLGRVVKGKQLGRTIKVPTLNINPDHELYPPTGVYATMTRCGDSYFRSITNIGNRPTFDEGTNSDINIETHLFDFSGNLYDHTIEVFFIEKIRDEKKFTSVNELKKNIEKDFSTAMKIFDSREHSHILY